MSTIRGTTALGSVTAKRQVYSPLETCWNAFQEWRKRKRMLANLCDLSDRELMDIGITRSEIDYLASHRGRDPGAVPAGEWMSISGSDSRSESSLTEGSWRRW